MYSGLFCFFVIFLFFFFLFLVFGCCWGKEKPPFWLAFCFLGPNDWICGGRNLEKIGFQILSICLPICLPLCLSFCLPGLVCLPDCLLLSVCATFSLSAYLDCQPTCYFFFHCLLFLGSGSEGDEVL